VELDDGGKWVVLIEAFPAKPEDHILVTIGKDGKNVVSEASISKNEAIALAAAHLQKIGGLPPSFEIASVERDDSGKWEILIEMFPPVPEGHTLVTIDKHRSVEVLGGM
jgi:hypothetical protein